MALEDLLDETRQHRRYHLWRLYYRYRWRLQRPFRRAWLSLQHRYPRLHNEGAATARVIDNTFDGYPFAEKYRDKEEAVMHLQLIWDLLDDWGDGRRVNVHRLYAGTGTIEAEYRADYERERAAREAVVEPDDLASLTFDPQPHTTRLLRGHVIRDRDDTAARTLDAE